MCIECLSEDVQVVVENAVADALAKLRADLDAVRAGLVTLESTVKEIFSQTEQWSSSDTESDSP